MPIDSGLIRIDLELVWDELRINSVGWVSLLFILFVSVLYQSFLVLSSTGSLNEGKAFT